MCIRDRRHAIDAVALAAWRRAVGKHMALMGAAPNADDFSPDHAVAGVADIFQVVGRKGRGEARPASAAFKLPASAEQRQAAKPASVDPFPLLIEKQAAKGRLGAMLQQYVPFLLVEIGLQLVELGFGRRGQIKRERRGVDHGSSFSLATAK